MTPQAPVQPPQPTIVPTASPTPPQMTAPQSIPAPQAPLMTPTAPQPYPPYPPYAYPPVAGTPPDTTPDAVRLERGRQNGLFWVALLSLGALIALSAIARDAVVAFGGGLGDWMLSLVIIAIAVVAVNVVFLLAMRPRW